jgi:hypothetical protein
LLDDSLDLGDIDLSQLDEILVRLLDSHVLDELGSMGRDDLQILIRLFCNCERPIPLSH